MFVVTLTYIRPLAEVDAQIDAHVAWLRTHYASGLFLASGRRIPREGGVILARSGDRGALDAALADDPFARHGLVATQVVEFAPTMTADAARALEGL